MSFPGIFANLFENDGLGPKLRSDIIPVQNYTTLAEALDTDGQAVGDPNKPVYISQEGKPVSILHSVNKDVPADAVFTDTNDATEQRPSETAFQRPVLLSTSENGTTVTSAALFADGVTVNPATDTVHARGFVSSEMSGNILVGSQGSHSVVESTATPGEYTTLVRWPAVSGVFTLSGQAGTLSLNYVDSEIITAQRKEATAKLDLLDSTGASRFPGNVTAARFVGPLTGDVNGKANEAASADLAAEATALSSKSVGSGYNPVYIDSEGKPRPCAFEGYATVPSTAKFTDRYVNTVYDPSRKVYFTGRADTETASDVTLYYDTAIYTDDVSGVLHATKFVGPLTGDVTGSCSGSSSSCTGNANTATALNTPRTIALSGDATGQVVFDGSSDVIMAVYIPEATPSNHHATHATGGTDPVTPQEIGALDLAGGSLTGRINTSGMSGNVLAVDSDGQLDLSKANCFTLSLVQDTVLYLKNVTLSRSTQFQVMITVGSSAYNLSWFPGVVWDGGVTPTLPAAAKKVFEFWTADGSVWFGKVKYSA